MKHFLPPREFADVLNGRHGKDTCCNVPKKQPLDEWIQQRHGDEGQQELQEKFQWAGVDMVPTLNWREMMLWLSNNPHRRILAPGGDAIIYTTGRSVISYDRSTWCAHTICT